MEKDVTNDWGYREPKVDPETGEVIEADDGFRVTDTRSAEWVLYKIGQYESEAAGLRERLKRITEHLQAMISRCESSAAFFQSRYGDQLMDVAVANMKEGSKTWKTPYGSVGFRSMPAFVEVKDEGELIRFLEDRFEGDGVVVSKRLSKTRVKELIKEGRLSRSDLAELVQPGDKAFVKAL